MWRVAAAFVIALAACKRGEETPAKGAAAKSELRAPEPWTLGAAGDRQLALPPPCALRADMLRTVLPRETLIVAERQTPGTLLAAEVSRAPEERVDAAGRVSMTLGRADFHALPWPARGKPLAARAGERWLLAWQAPDGARLWRGTSEDKLGDKLAPVDLSCHGQRCGLLASSEGAPRLLVGSPDEPVSVWRSISLPAGRALRLAAPARALLISEGKLALVNDDGRRAAELPAPYGVLDALGRRALIAALPAAAPRCDAEAGGLVIAGDGVHLRLRSGLPAVRATLSALDGGLLVLWLAPNDCESPRKTLYAGVVRLDGTPVGPITAVGAATDFAVAARGDTFDLWIEHERTLSWAPARCVLAP